jgi:co-chaperonin GroES (HSP10)
MIKYLTKNIYKNEIGIRVKYPDEVYTKNYQGKLSTIYLEKSKTADMEAIVAIVDNKSGR